MGAESFTSYINIKRYKSGSIYESLHNGDKFSFAKFNLSLLNLEVSVHHEDNHTSIAFTILLLLSNY